MNLTCKSLEPWEINLNYDLYLVLTNWRVALLGKTEKSMISLETLL